MTDSPAPSPEVQEDELHVFLCYRRNDGYAAAEKIHKVIDGQRMELLDGSKVPIRVFFDVDMPGYADWQAHHAPALQQSRAMIIVITPGLAANLSTDDQPDWVRKEIDWWMRNYPDVSPILVDCTGEGLRFLPEFAREWWTKVQRVSLDCDRLDDLDKDYENDVRQRIIQGIKDREGLVRYKQVEKLENALTGEKQATRLLKMAVVFLILVVCGLLYFWKEATEQTRRANDQRLVALAGEWMNKDPTKAALILLRVQQSGVASCRLREVLQYATTEFEVPHDDWVTAVSFSPDGRRIVTASRSGTAKICEISSERNARPIELRHLKAVTAVDFSPNSQRCVTASQDGIAIIWKITDSGVVENHRFNAGEAVLQALFSPQGHLIVTTTETGDVKLWNDQGSWVADLQGHSGAVVAASFNKTGHWLVTGSYDDTARIWDISSRKEVAQLPHRGTVHRVQFSPDDRRIVTASDDGQAHVWRISPSQDGLRVEFPAEAELHHDGPVLAAAFSPDGQYIVTGSEDRTAKLWTVTTSGVAQKGNALLHNGVVRAATFGPDGRFVTASDDGTARIWKSGDGSLESELRGHSGPVVAAVFSRDGRRIATASDDGYAKVWRPDGLSSEVRLEKRRIRAATLASKNHFLITGGENEALELWQLNDSEELFSLGSLDAATEEIPRVSEVTLSPDGARAIAVGEDVTRLWQLDAHGAGHADSTPIPDDAVVLNAGFSPDGQRIATIGADPVTGKNRVRIWNAEKPEQPLAEFSPGGETAMVAFSSNNRWIMSAEEAPRRVGRIWDLEGAQGEKSTVEFPVFGKPLAAAFCNRDQRVVMASGDGHSLKMVSQQFPQPLESPDLVRRTLDAPVTNAALSLDCRKLVVATRDGIARVFEIQDYRTQPAEIARLRHGNKIVALGFERAADRVVIVESNSVRIWPLSMASLRAAVEDRVTLTLDARFLDSHSCEASKSRGERP